MDIQTGDRVAYSVQFCRSIGMTGKLPFKRGEALLVTACFAFVLWADGSITKVLVTNLVKVYSRKT